MADETLRSQGKEISKYISKLPSEIKKLQDHDKQRYLTDFNEKSYLTEEKQFFEDHFNCAIQIYSADDNDKEDPEQKSRFAMPLKPAIYIEE